MRFESCCGCCQLSVGCIVIGVVGIFFDILKIKILIWIHGSYQDSNIKFFIAWTSIVIVIYIIINALLISGVALRRRFYLVPWIIAHILRNIFEWLAVLFIMILAITLWIIEASEARNLVLTILFLLVLIAAIETFFIKIVTDHFLELRDEERRGHFQINQHRTYAYEPYGPYGHLIRPPNQYSSYPTQFGAYPIPSSAPATFDAAKTP